MNTITLYNLIITVCVTITTVSAAIAVIVKVIQLLKRPEKSQNERLSALESRMENVEKHLDNDNRRLNDIEECMKKLMKSNLAILRYLVDSENKEELTKQIKDISDYLVER